MTQIVQILELRQTRCAERFGTSPCTATGTPKCFQTYNTCEDQANYNPTGQLSWYFTRPGDPRVITADQPSSNEVHGPAIPILQTVSSRPTRLNLGAVRENESPFGLRGTISATLQDFEFRNQFGDFYASERTVRGSIGRLILAWLGEAVPQLQMYLYTGRKGDALADMTVQRYDVTNISPPSGGVWTIEGMDLLARASRKKAEFPRATDLRLQQALGETDTVISVSGLESDVSDAFGNDGYFYGRFGSEIIRYTGYSGSDGVWMLTGVVRGQLGTSTESHAVDAGFQRVGHYRSIQYWQLVYDLLTNHTTIPADVIPYADEWTNEGNTYLSSLAGTGTFSEPRPVEEICAEAMRDGMFSLWWDERAQKVKIKALRQPIETPREITERGGIVSSAIKRTPDDRRTRVTIYYNRQNPAVSLTDSTNYATQRIRIDAEAESESYADGTVRNLVWYSALMRTDTNALLVQASFLQRYRQTPQYIELTLADKDGDLGIGDVVQVTSYDVLDTLGNPVTDSWQIIEWEEADPGFAYRVLCQSFALFDRPAYIMPDSAPTFAAASGAEKVNACFMSDGDLMPDGSAPYLIQ